MAFRFSYAFVRLMPAWLRRTNGLRLLESLGEQVDAVVDLTVAGVAMRFPYDDHDEDALAQIGRERRIRRGPSESATTYATRLREWWTEHQVRGGPYAMLRQLRAYFAGIVNAPISIVYHSGARFTIAVDGTITRDSITWDPNTDEWAQIWIFFETGVGGFGSGFGPGFGG